MYRIASASPEGLKASQRPGGIDDSACASWAENRAAQYPQQSAVSSVGLLLATVAGLYSAMHKAAIAGRTLVAFSVPAITLTC